MSRHILTFLLLFIVNTLSAQTIQESEITYVNGFEKKIAGSDFNYHSSISIARDCLLARATDGTSSVEWQSSPIPLKPLTDKVCFAWLAAIGSSPGVAAFDVEVQGVKRFTFYTDGKDHWSIKDNKGASLRFKKDMIDQYGDRFGFMFLTLPTSELKPGQPITIKVTGRKENKSSWYIVYVLPLNDGLNFKALPALTETDHGEQQLAIAGIMHYGKDNKVKVFVNDKFVVEDSLHFGYNYIKIALPPVTLETKESYRIETGEKTWEGELLRKPVKRWQVDFIQHSHTDIGYTRPQGEILAEHLRYIDYALDYCDLTDDMPEESKFRWTCETSWAVDEYVRTRPFSQIERLKKRVKEGRIALTGMYLNYDELPNEWLLSASLDAVATIREEGLKVESAMQNDVNGIGWVLADLFPQLGIKYLNMGTHGHRALICFDKPTLFWWESPSGNRVLTFRAEHYMTGNTLFKIHGSDFNIFEEELLSYLTKLEEKGYPYDLIAIQHSGYQTDNAPPSTLASEMIAQWNKKYSWPKLCTSTLDGFFSTMEEKYQDEIPVIKGAWPDWWTDGFGASTREVEAIREAQQDLASVQALFAMSSFDRTIFPEALEYRRQEAIKTMLFYVEHTLGYHASVREPWNINTMEQRAIKESYAWEAKRRVNSLKEEALGYLQSKFSKAIYPSIYVFNTQCTRLNTMTKVYIDHQIIPKNQPFVIIDNQDNQMEVHLEESFPDGDVWSIYCHDLPPFGYKKLDIYPQTIHTLTDNKPEANVDLTNPMKNEYYRITFNLKRGTISQIYDYELKRNLLDDTSRWQFGEVIHEELGNREQLEMFHLTDYRRSTPDSVWLDRTESGEIWDAVVFKAKTPLCMEGSLLEIEYRLFHPEKRIDVIYRLNKKSVTSPEGVYIAFPFESKEGQIALDVAGGEMIAGRDQIVGSANDWNTMQRYVRVFNAQDQIMLSSPGAPLIQAGGINTGRFQADARPATTHIYGWPMNNYWTTNFNAEQRGSMKFSYSFSSGRNSRTDAIVWGNKVCNTPPARVIPGGGDLPNDLEDMNEQSWIIGWPENITLVSAMTNTMGDVVLIQVRETEGLTTQLELSTEDGNHYRITPADAVGNPLPKGDKTIKPFENRFFLLR